MQVFSFDPTTGKRGDIIGMAKCAQWTGSYHPDYRDMPLHFGKDADPAVYTDAGIGGVLDEISYRTDRWVCFCLGNFRVGMACDDKPIYRWQWVVLPPLPSHDPRLDEGM